MILAIDFGNTRVKAAVFEQNTVVSTYGFETAEIHNKISAICMAFPKIIQIVAASVSDVDQNALLGFGIPVHFITNQSEFPFQNNYATPQSLGVDRLLLSAGAVIKYPNQNRLVIDAGTCITYDFTDSNDAYHGGAISPGLRLRYESLHAYTARLPLLQIEAPDSLIGNSTAGSIHSGVVNGTLNEIDGFIERYRADYPNFIIILTGGDGEFLAGRLKNTIFANSNFLLESLNQTFLYQSNK